MTKNELETKLLEGLQSGDPKPVTEAFWQRLHRMVVNEDVCNTPAPSYP